MSSRQLGGAGRGAPVVLDVRLRLLVLVLLKVPDRVPVVPLEALGRIATTPRQYQNTFFRTPCQYQNTLFQNTLSVPEHLVSEHLVSTRSGSARVSSRAAGGLHVRRQGRGCSRGRGMGVDVACPISTG